MNWQRIALLLKFDLFYSLLGLRAWIFLLPFFLCWFAVFRQVDNGVTELFQSQEGLMITSALYGTDGALTLFIDHPPNISIFYLVTLTTIPFFIVLAAYDQFSTDLGSGFLRFLVVRCKRVEIFIARYLSSLALVAGAFLIGTVVSAILSLKNDDYPLSEVLLYSGQVYLTLILYAMAFIAYMSLVSALVRSTLASLFLGFAGYALIWFLKLLTFFSEGSDVFSYAMASVFKDSLIRIDTGEFFTAVATLPIYILIYCGLAYFVFRRRNL